jgi:hypothetical protein
VIAIVSQVTALTTMKLQSRQIAVSLGVCQKVLCGRTVCRYGNFVVAGKRDGYIACFWRNFVQRERFSFHHNFSTPSQTKIENQKPFKVTSSRREQTFLLVRDHSLPPYFSTSIIAFDITHRFRLDPATAFIIIRISAATSSNVYMAARDPSSNLPIGIPS